MSEPTIRGLNGVADLHEGAVAMMGALTALLWVGIALLLLLNLTMAAFVFMESRRARTKGEPVNPAMTGALRRMTMGTLLMVTLVPAVLWLASGAVRGWHEEVRVRETRVASMSVPLRAQVRVGGRWRTLESASGESSCLWAALRYPGLDIEVRTGEQVLRPGMGLQVRLPEAGRPPQDWMAAEVYCHEYLGPGPYLRWVEARFAD